MTEIKICGITCKEDINIINEFPIAYAGFVLYVRGSKRNLPLEQAQQLKDGLKESVKTVAVTVSPTKEQVELIQEAGFDVIQIHGTLHREVEQFVKIPIFRAVNVETEEDIQKVMMEASNKISNFVFDGRTPGGGETFDWGMLKKTVDNTSKIVLAGGLTEKNVGEAIKLLHPGIVDVSSGVEKETGKGKDREKIAQFVKAVFN